MPIFPDKSLGLKILKRSVLFSKPTRPIYPPMTSHTLREVTRLQVSYKAIRGARQKEVWGCILELTQQYPEQVFKSYDVWEVYAKKYPERAAKVVNERAWISTILDRIKEVEKYDKGYYRISGHAVREIGLHTKTES